MEMASEATPVDASFEIVRLPFNYDIFGTTRAAAQPSNAEHLIAGGVPPKPSGKSEMPNAKPLRSREINTGRAQTGWVEGMQAGRERPRPLRGSSAQRPLCAAEPTSRVAPDQPASETTRSFVRLRRMGSLGDDYCMSGTCSRSTPRARIAVCTRHTRPFAHRIRGVDVVPYTHTTQFQRKETQPCPSFTDNRNVQRRSR
jgi:hypothetical protein